MQKPLPCKVLQRECAGRAIQNKKPRVIKPWASIYSSVAEGEGFEPPEGSHLQRFSRPPRSTALPPLRRVRALALHKLVMYSALKFKGGCPSTQNILFMRHDSLGSQCQPLGSQWAVSGQTVAVNGQFLGSQWADSGQTVAVNGQFLGSQWVACGQPVVQPGQFVWQPVQPVPFVGNLSDGGACTSTLAPYLYRDFWGMRRACTDFQRGMRRSFCGGLCWGLWCAGEAVSEIKKTTRSPHRGKNAP